MTRVDTTACDVEPIHIPGKIQPHGVLVALDASTLAILQVSANCTDYFGVPAASVCGKPLRALVGEVATRLLAAVATPSSSVGEPSTIEVEGRLLDVSIHHHQGVIILEIEAHDPSALASDATLRHALARLQRPNSVAQLCAITVEAVRALTGFDRVMLYRFDSDGHGDVTAEALAPGVDSYNGLWFPASDIPRQARELYVLNWLRLIPDARYTPVPLVPALRPDTQRPLDLSFASLRSVSPVHLEYLLNMGVRASMSVSLVEHHRLWGLIACHHRTPNYIPFAARAACELIGRVVSLQIAAQLELDVRAARAALRGTEARLVDAMRENQAGIIAALAQRGDALLELVGASGAAVATAGEIRTVGVTPSHAQLVELVAWLRSNAGGAVLQTDRLASLYAPAAPYAHVASGLVAITLPGSTPACVLWFRPEVVQTVTWAGNPEKAVTVTDGGATLHPRHSFAAWTEIVRGRSKPWRAAEVDAAEDLRRRAIEVDLTNQIATAEQAVRARDEMVAVVSHDLKSPLQVIELSASVLKLLTTADPAARTTVEAVERAVGRMNRLIGDLLDLGKIESGRFDVLPRECARSQLLSDVSLILGPIAEAKNVRLEWWAEGDPRVDADSDRIFQVLSNIVGNAIKFTPSGGVVRVAARRIDSLVRFSVKDSGPGIAPAELAHVFDRYWQARRASRAGSGLGLFIAKGIVEAHGQTLWVESAHGGGTTFSFTLRALPT